ncbi:MAG: hypothetical protein VX438_16100 [Planctomycetota bacterium]|nr:hypothetical protein [Planctomycetota bacterium]
MPTPLSFWRCLGIAKHKTPQGSLKKNDRKTCQSNPYKTLAFVSLFETENGDPGSENQPARVCHGKHQKTVIQIK